MLDKAKKATFWLAILGAGKLVAEGFGVHFDDALINGLADGLAALVTLVGIVKDHGANNNITS
jgi:uncharacterized membrane protein